MSKFFLFRNISRRLAFFIALLLVIAVVTYGWISTKETTNTLHAQAKKKANSEIKSEAKRFENYFTQARQDLLFLSKLPQLKDLIRQRKDTLPLVGVRKSNQKLLIDLKHTFTQFASSRKVFSTIRFIDFNGKEVIKVSSNLKGKASFADDQELKNCRNEGFFAQTRQLARGDFYHTLPNLGANSQENLNALGNPTMLYATPIMDGESKHWGMIVAKLELRPLLNELQQWEKDDNLEHKNNVYTRLSLVGPYGTMIYNANNTILWQKTSYDKDSLNAYPSEVAMLLKSPENRAIEVDNNIYATGKVALNNTGQDNYLVLLYEIPGKLLNHANKLIWWFVVVGVIILVVSVIVITFLSRIHIERRLKTLQNHVKQLMKGNTPDEIPTHIEDEIGQITTEINLLTRNIDQMVSFADRVGTGNYDTEIAFDKDIVLGTTLIKMRDNLKVSAEKQDKNKWVNQGLAHFSGILRTQDDLKEVGNEVILEVVKYLNALQGIIYQLSDDNPEELIFLAAYGFDQDTQKERLSIHDGLTGQAFRQKESIHITNVPDDYGYIKSVSGKSSPKNVLIVPLIVQEQVKGVLEVASFNSIQDYEVQFVKQLAEAIAVTISSVKSNEKTTKLLRKSQESEQALRDKEETLKDRMKELEAAQKEVEFKTQQIEEQKKQIEKSLEEKTEQTEMLLAQEEEMRQNMEELQATQEAMSEKQRELEKAKKKLEVNEQVLKKAYKKARDRELEIKQKNEELKAQEEEMRQNMEELKATQEAMERKQLELESANKKLAANEKVLKMAYEQVKESETEIRQKNEEILKQSNVLEEAKDELERKNKKMAANERVLKKAYEKIRSQEQGLKDTINQLQTTEEELRQNMEELQTTQEALQDKTRSLEVKNKLITNSINYAKNIQTAILPKKEEMDNAFSDYYVLYMPKDIVSGDFYWFRQVSENTVYLAIVDCTGHGVPGALMSMIGSSLLNRTISERKILAPGKILENVHMGIRARLRQAEANSGDGMVISMASIEKKPDNMFNITFAAAKQNIYYIEEDGEMKTIKGDRKSIGGWQRESYRTFSDQTIQLKKGTKIYFTTDGILDNPNPRRKRFGEKYLKHIIMENYNLPFDTQKQILAERLAAHQQDADQRDDITVIGIQL